MRSTRRTLAMASLAITIAVAGCGQSGPSARSVHAARQQCVAEAEAAGFAAGTGQDSFLAGGASYTEHDFATCIQSAKEHGRADRYTLSLLNGGVPGG